LPKNTDECEPQHQPKGFELFSAFYAEVFLNAPVLHSNATGSRQSISPSRPESKMPIPDDHMKHLDANEAK